jgi:hypothetical protein
MARWLSRQSEHERVEALLSPYLDGRTSEAECALVERHLKSCSDCARNLATLQATAAAVREMPRVRAPRSFALPHSMARQPETASWMIPALRAATVIATLLLVVTVAGDVFLSSRTYPTYAPMAAPASLARETAATSAPTAASQKAAPKAAQELALPVSPTPITEPPTEQPFSGGGVGAGGGQTDQTGESTRSPSAVALAPASPSARQMSASATAVTATAKLAESVPTPTAQRQATTAPTASPAPTEIARAPAPQPLAAAQPKVAPEVVSPAVNPWRIAEGALAVLALVLGVTTWIVYRRRR